jgi:hypothetical protein
MKTHFVIRLALYSILAIFLIYPVTSYCQVRPATAMHCTIAHRSYSYYYVEMTSPPFDDYHTSDTYYYYHYQPDNPELIDYVIAEGSSDDNGSVSTGSTTVDYTGSVTTANGLKHIHYTTSTNKTIDIIKDSQNRFLEFTDTGALFPYRSIKNYYNEFGKLDSLKSVNENGSYTNRLHYNDLGNLDLLSYTQDGVVNPEVVQIPITYAANLPTNAIDFNLEDALQYYDGSLLMKYRMIFDPHYQVASFDLPWFTPSLVTPLYGYWNNYYTISFHNTLNYGVSFSSATGYLLSYNNTTGGNPSTSNSVSFTWESIVPNDDPEAPKPSLSLNIYPNPFRNNVNIEIKDLTTAPSDIAIYNIKGQLMRKWSDNRSSSVVWDGKDRSDNPVSSGIYLIKVIQNGKSQTNKIVKY